MSDLTCRYCATPTAGSSLCEPCAKTLMFAVANVAGHYTDLGTVAQKRARYSSQGATKGSIGKTQPLVVDMRFVSAGPPSEEDRSGRPRPATIAPLTQLRWDAWNTVVAWCRTMMDEQSQVFGPVCTTCLHRSCHIIRFRRWPQNTIQSMCLYLDKHHRWIEGRDWAGVMLDEFLDLERRLTRAVNRPPDRWYAGKCSARNDIDAPGLMCRVDLYATEDRGIIDCPGCGARHDVTQRREILLKEAADIHVTATEAAGALIAWTDYDGSEGKLVDRIRKWRDREKLEVRDVTSLQGKDRHLYRLGDIQNLLVQHAQSEQERTLVS